MQGVKHTTSQIFHVVSCILPNMSRKFHENPPMRFRVMLLTDKQQAYKPTEMKT